MDQERSAAITIGGKEYELVLTTRATKEIAGRYGGLENLGDKLMKSENFEMALDEIIWLITLLANQSVLIHNLRHHDEDVDQSIRNLTKIGSKGMNETDKLVLEIMTGK